MRFTVAGKVYVVEISANVIRRGGEERAAWFDPINRRILLSETLPRENRRHALTHELRHAWTHAHGLRADMEADAQDVATFTDWISDALEQQGGNAALMKMEPTVEPGPSGAVARGITSQRECGYCGAPVAPGSIAGATPRYHVAAGTTVVDRGMCCPACEHVTAWTELCADDGTPRGEYLSEPPPRVLRGADEQAWLERWGEVARVMVG